jgi:CPA2 family monovalent cation:H+ antiporter-2
MEHASLLVTLVLALGVAVVGAAVAARLGQSVILGYILAGIVISPYTSGVLGRRTTVAEMADIGIILLLFALGVRLSFRDLLRVGPVALVGGTVQVLALLGLGAVAGLVLGWPPTEALFFGW